MYKKIIHDSKLPSDTPLFTMGMSNGGAMATTVGYVFHKAGYAVRAVAAYEGGFVQPLIEAGDYDVPTFLVLAENDMIINNDRLKSVYHALHQANRPIELHIARERALDTSWLESYGVESPQKALTSLMNKGFVDREGARQVDFATLREKGRTALAFPELGDDAGATRNAVMAAWALHKMRSDYRNEQLGYFESARGGGE